MKEFIRGFRYDATKRAARFEVCAPGSRGRRRVRRWLRDIGRDEAKREFARFRERVREGRLDEKPTTVPADFAAFIEQSWPVGDLGPKTLYNETLTVEKALVPFFGRLRLRDITEATLTSFRRSQAQAGRANSTTNGRMRVLRKLLRFAQRQGFVVGTPHFPPPLREERVQNELDDAERKAFVTAFDKTVNESMRAAKPLFVAAIETGLARADLLDLRRKEVDFEAGIIVRSRRKTGVASKVPISRDCRAAIAQALRRGAVEKSAHVFVTLRGKPYSPVMWDRYFREALRLAKITRHVRPHDLRHTYGSRLASKGVPLMFIREAMGHSDLKTTQRYAKVSVEALAAILTAMDGPVARRSTKAR